MLRIIVDTASDITREEAERLNLVLIPLTIMFGEEYCPCETEEDRERFFQKLFQAKELPSTSQPSPSLYLEAYKEAEACGDEVLVLTLSEGLSGTYQSACIARTMTEYQPITVVNTGNVITGERMIIDMALKMREQGRSREEIAARVEAVRDRVVLCGAVDSLEYLKKGGRIPAPLAMVGAALKLKPALCIRNGVIEQLAKSRGMKQAASRLYDEYEAEELDPEFPVYFGYVYGQKPAIEFMEETVQRYGLKDVKMFPVGPTIAVHTGPGCIIMVFVRK